MDFPKTKKMLDLRIGDVFIENGFTYVVIAVPYDGVVWVTKPEFVNKEDIYGYTSAALLQYEPDDEVIVLNKDKHI